MRAPEPSVREPDPLICVGVVAAAHGVRGQLKIKSFTALDEDVAAYGPLHDETGRVLFELELRGRAKGTLIAKARGIEDRDAAEALRGLRLFVRRSALGAAEEDEFFYEDLIGLEARGLDGSRLGAIRAVADFGAGDVLEVALDGGGSAMAPFTRQFAPEVSIAGGFVRIDGDALRALAIGVPALSETSGDAPEPIGRDAARPSAEAAS